MSASIDVAVRFLIAMLLAGLWQAPLFALAAWAVLRIASSANATTRHSVLAAALFAALALPVATAALAMQHGSDVSVQTSDLNIPKGSRPYVPVKTAPSIPKSTRLPATNPAPVLSVPAFARFNLSLPHWAAIAIVAVWLTCAGVVLIRLAASLVHLERLKRDSLPLGVEYRSSLTRWSAATKGSRDVRLCNSGEIDIPIAVGLFDAMILVPQRLIDELPPHDIDAIVLHELAHLRRSDDWVNAIERIASAVLFFNPGILWLAGQLDLEREVACDDWVLQQNDALPYATCLAKVAETAAWPHRAMSAPGAFVTRRGMSIRIERLLSKHRDVRVRTSFGLAGSAIALLGALGLVAAFVSPSIAYDVAPPPPVAIAAPVRSPAPPAKPVAARPTHRAAVAAKSPLHAVPAAIATPIGVSLAKPVAVAIAQPIARAVAVAVAPNPPAVPAAHASAPSERDESSDSHEQIVAEASDPDYVDELARAGYAHLSIDDLIKLKSVGVTADFIRALERNGLGHPSVDELVKLRSVGVDPHFAGDMRKRYGRSLSVDDLISLRAVGVDSEYVRGLSAAGVNVVNVDDVRKLRSLGVDPDYIRSLARVGYSGLSVDDIAGLRAVGVTPDYVSKLERQGIPRPSLEDLRQYSAVGIDPDYVAAMRKRFGDSIGIDRITGLRAVGVTPEYVDGLRSAGLRSLTPERAQELRATGVTPEYLRDLASAGYANLSTDEIQQLRALGIDAAFIRHADSHGFHHPTVDQLVKLRATGVF